MIYSMTGYGKGTAENGKIKVDVEVKSINSRYLDILLRIPSSLMSREFDLREVIKNKINRGKLSVIIQIKNNGSGGDAISVNEDKLKNYIAVIKSLKKKAKITGVIKIEHLLANKEIFEINETEISDEEFEVIKKALGAALEELQTMKLNEGKELSKDLKKRIGIIETKLSEIEKDSESTIKEYYEKLKEKVRLIIENTKIDDDRIEMELAIIAEKADITEECVRLRSHLKFFIDSLEKDTEPGRKMNFLCQEMNRETNTISSKTISTFITHNTVLIKEEIEKIREQIQNIE